VIQPLLVIDQADQRLLLGHVGEQAQNRQPEEKTIWRRPVTNAERSPQRIALRHRQTFQVIQHRRQQLMQPGKRKLHLRLNTCGAHHPAARRLVDQVVQQGRLAHARLAAQYQCPALTRANILGEPVEHTAFAAPAD
jgi:hypothetical protein